MTEIEMADKVAFGIIPETDPDDITAHSYRLVAYRAAIHMHTMGRAEIDAKDADIAELVECLAAALADPMRLINSESAMNETATLIAKHRPDAFAKWADGLIEGNDK